MAGISNDKLNELLLQAKYSPVEKRLQQLDACEALVRLVYPGLSYPYEFVCFHLTGYRPKSGADEDGTICGTISYKDLCADLSVYAVELSKTAVTDVSNYEKRVYTVEKLEKRFCVSEKTIGRWRKEGLIGRYMLFPDGRRRLGFRASSVDFFVKRHRNKVNKGRAFSQLDDEQKRSILKRLARWSIVCPDYRQEAIRRTARRFGRSVETVRLLLTNYETAHHEGGLFSGSDGKEIRIAFQRRANDITEPLRTEIWRSYEQGMTAEQLVSRFGRSRSNIYHAINQTWAQRLAERRIEYIYNKEFDDQRLKGDILTSPPNLFGLEWQEFVGKSTQDKIGCLSESGPAGGGVENDKEKTGALNESLGMYYSQIANHDILTQRQEQFLFRKYNYLKYHTSKLIAKLDAEQPCGTNIRSVRRMLKATECLKQVLIQSNLRLVVSVARRHTRRQEEMLDLISEGNMTLMNAVEKFDYSKGFKFSTYASWALAKRFATFRAGIAKHSAITPGEEILEVTSDLRIPASRITALETARKSLHEVMTEILEDRERQIVKAHYGLTEEPDIPIQRKAKSLTQIGKLLGLSKERVRQIELKALQKLRKLLSPEQFDTLINA